MLNLLFASLTNVTRDRLVWCAAVLTLFVQMHDAVHSIYLRVYTWFAWWFIYGGMAMMFDLLCQNIFASHRSMMCMDDFFITTLLVVFFALFKSLVFLNWKFFWYLGPNKWWLSGKNYLNFLHNLRAVPKHQ